MDKISNRTYKGIEYIQLSSLPTNQAKSLMQSLNERTLIKILKDEVILNDCVLYSAYEKWFVTYAKNAKVPIAQQVKPSFSKPVTVG